MITLKTKAKNKMTAPAQKKAKEMGLKSLKQATELGWARSTLVDMHNNRPDRFEIVILGCLVKLDQMRKAVK